MSEQLKTRLMVEMADSSEEALPAGCLQTNQKQSEKYHQLGVPAWEKILGSTIGTLKARSDVGRSAILIVDTHARTGEVPSAVVQMLSHFRMPCYYFGHIADNKKIDEHAFLQHHLLTAMTDKVLRQELTLPSFKLFDAADVIPEEQISQSKLTVLQWSSKDGLICPDALKKRWGTHGKVFRWLQ